MNAYSVKTDKLEREFSTSALYGLKRTQVDANRRRFGKNELEKKKKSSFKRFIEALSEPTLVILEFAWVITVGVNLGKFIKTGSCDVYECIGILAAILISACLTVFMEGRSEKAFEILGAVYDKISVKVIRDGKTVVIPKEELVAGDVAFIETGDKIVADGRLIESNGLKTDESMLTGESDRVSKTVCELSDKRRLPNERTAFIRERSQVRVRAK